MQGSRKGKFRFKISGIDLDQYKKDVPKTRIQTHNYQTNKINLRERQVHSKPQAKSLLLGQQSVFNNYLTTKNKRFKKQLNMINESFELGNISIGKFKFP